jgi:hypothetical protein
MNIIAKLKPLYDDLIKIGIIVFMKDNEFVRTCNELSITNQYAEVHNLVMENSNNSLSWLSGDFISHEEILAGLLNQLYTDESIDFVKTICQLTTAVIPHSYYISSVSEVQRDLQLLGASSTQIQVIDNAWQLENRNYHKKVRILKEITTARATGGFAEEEYYQTIRSALITNSLLKNRVPDFIIKNTTAQEFWQFIKHKFGSYAERRFFLQEEFEPLLNASLALSSMSPHQDLIPEIILQINEHYIGETWRKALIRMKEDPEAAITSARSLVELVCKHILDETNTGYDDGADLPKLYKLTATKLNLAPDQHTEQLFKQILGGCQTVIEGLGELRNKLGDAHGKSKLRARPSERHAALAVNLSGAMCSFLLQTYLHIQN